jgi:hypothetical protein
LLAGVLLGACATTPPTEQTWPASAPPLEHFERVYAADPANQAVQSRDEYLVWIVRFYEGWELYRQGWQDVTREVLEAVADSPDHAYVQSAMARLGKRISAEWAKDSRDRRIRTPTVVAWGTALQHSVQQAEVADLVRRVEADVTDLLAGRLDPREIRFERYYPESDDGDFF